MIGCVGLAVGTAVDTRTRQIDLERTTHTVQFTKPLINCKLERQFGGHRYSQLAIGLSNAGEGGHKLQQCGREML